VKAQLDQIKAERAAPWGRRRPRRSARACTRRPGRRAGLVARARTPPSRTSHCNTLGTGAPSPSRRPGGGGVGELAPQHARHRCPKVGPTPCRRCRRAVGARRPLGRTDRGQRRPRRHRAWRRRTTRWAALVTRAWSPERDRLPAVGRRGLCRRVVSYRAWYLFAVAGLGGADAALDVTVQHAELAHARPSARPRARSAIAPASQPSRSGSRSTTWCGRRWS
jgi:hypothetical protein